MAKQEWQIHLEHRKFVRNSIAKMNGIDPASFNDPDGGFQDLSASRYRVFFGAEFQKDMKGSIHSAASYENCKCNPKNSRIYL